MVTYPLDAWTLLGDPSRRAIIGRLSNGPCTVTEIASAMPISRPAVSQHLKLLREAGVVHDSPSGRTRVYSIDGARLDKYRRELDGFWAGALGSLPASETNVRGVG